MTLQSINVDDARRLLTAMRDSTFGWTVAEVPELMRSLGWTLIEVIPGKGAIADTAFGVPDTDAELLYEGETVQSITIYACNAAGDERADRLAVLDVFALLCAIATDVLGPATAVIPGDVPRAQWRGTTDTITVQNTGSRVLIDWCRNEYQDFNDSIGRY